MNNEERSALALTQIDAFAQATGIQDENMETKISDFLADLMHLADSHNVSWSDVVRRSEDHYIAEQQEEVIEYNEKEANWLTIDGRREYFCIDDSAGNFTVAVPEFAAERWQTTFSTFADAKSYADKAYEAIRDFHTLEHTQLSDDDNGNSCIAESFLHFEIGTRKDLKVGKNSRAIVQMYSSKGRIRKETVEH